MIKLENVTKKFGDVTAVDSVSLDVRKGECFTILGPNAAGKTTTIKLIAGLLRPASGEIYVAGYNLKNEYLEAKQLVSYIPDVPYLYEKLTGYEFLEFTARIFGIRQDKTGQKIKELIELFDISQYQHQLIEDYSRGLKQRLVICAALIHDPKIIVVDEPMSSLDPNGIRLVKDIFRKKVRDEGLTVFMSTHILSIAEEMADRIAIIHKGRIKAVGTINELRSSTHIEGMEEIFLQLTR